MASRRCKDHNYTEAETDWLRNNIDCYQWKQLVRRFNETFELDISYDAVVSFCIRKLQLRRNQKYTQFRKGETADTAHRVPIGYEKRDSRGTTWIKVANDWMPQRVPLTQNTNWKRKADIVWEKYHGEKPKGGIIIFLDKNKSNFEIQNLYCVDRKVNMMLSKNHWHSTNRDVTLAAIQYAKLFYALKGEQA